MFTKSFLAVTGALLAAVAAIPMAEPHHRHHPHHKRDIIWVTETEEIIKTIPVTKTVWIEPGEAVPTAHLTEDLKPASHAPSTAAAYVAPAAGSTAESSLQSIYVTQSPPYVAPVPSSIDVAPPVYSEPEPSSVYVAPTTTSTYIAPYDAPTTFTAAATAPTYAASDSSDSSSSGSGVGGVAAPGKKYTGDVTHYAVGMGSCGMTNTEDEKVVALSHEIMSVYNGGNPNKNPLCGTYISINGKDGNQHRAQIVDTCPGCDIGSLDLPEAFFNTITNNGDGRVGGIEWSFE